MATDPNILSRIQENDPDGGSKRPTAADYRAFRDWVKAWYGEKALKDYYNSGRRD